MAKKKAATRAAAKGPQTVDEIARDQEGQVVAEALAKQARGDRLSRGELKSLRDRERRQEQAAGERFLRAVPKKQYIAWTGRQTKILHEQARLYGAPLEGATIDVPELLRWLHDWLAENKHELSAIAKGDGGPKSGRGKLLDEEIEHRRQRNRILELQLAERVGELLPRDVMHDQLARCASILQRAGAQITKRFGNEAGDIVRNAIEDFESTLAEEVDVAATAAAAAEPPPD